MITIHILTTVDSQSQGPTSFSAVVLAITGVFPTDLMAQERKRIYEMKGNLKDVEARITEARKYYMQYCEEQWYAEGQGSLTRQLIGSLPEQVDWKHGRMDYLLSQFFMGYRYFTSYLCQIGKVDTYCVSLGTLQCH